MSKEQDFHKLIEEQNRSKKEQTWAAIDSQMEASSPTTPESSTITLSVDRRKIIIIAVTACLFLAVIFLIIFRVIYNNDNAFRYCDSGDYTVIDSQLTIEEYSDINNGRILYFSWINDAIESFNLEYRLNDSDETICFVQEIIDPNETTFTLYISDENIIIEEINYVESCNQIAAIDSTGIYFGQGPDEYYGYFTYDGFRYSFYSDDDINEQYYLSLCNDLLGS